MSLDYSYSEHAVGCAKTRRGKSVFVEPRKESGSRPDSFMPLASDSRGWECARSFFWIGRIHPRSSRMKSGLSLSVISKSQSIAQASGF